MPLPYRKTGEVLPDPLSVVYAKEAGELEAQAEADSAAIDPLERRLDSLALDIVHGKPEAVSEATAIEAKLAALRKSTRRNRNAAAQLREQAQNELQTEQWGRDRRLRIKACKVAGERTAHVKAFRNHIESALRAYSSFKKANDDLHELWSEKWPFKGPALTYQKDHVEKMAGHDLYVFAKKLNVAWPEIAYTQSNWPESGWLDKIKKANSWVSETLMAQPPPAEYEPLATVIDHEEVEPMPTPAPAPAEEPKPQPLTDAEIAKINDELAVAGVVDQSDPRVPPGWILSGGEYARREEKADARHPTVTSDDNFF
jgi:hypothetical protein